MVFEAAKRNPGQERIRRLWTVIGAYAIACLAAAILLPLALILRDAAVLGSDKVVRTMGLSDVGIVVLFAFLTSFVAAAPVSAALIVIAETRQIRSALAYLGFGALAGASAQLVAALIRGGASSGVGLYATIAGVGAVAGLLYWLVAVRPLPPPPPASLAEAGHRREPTL
ncbi:hypothetical protein [Methyloraptor flagellatus]|uniref:Uncharacterized protein n=1 Tax=Methyloraptor flagellatus TaxID=3162530 RepID=A0AAU7X855_9HYPH